MNKQKIYKVLENTAYVIFTIILLWFVVSFIDVIMHNMPWQDNVYKVWNLFDILF